MTRGRGDELIQRMRAGEHDAWREVYAAHAGRLLLWLRTQSPAADASTSQEDLAADTWLTAAEKITSFRGTRDDFAGWLFGIARGHARNAYRRSRRRDTQPDADAGHDRATLPLEDESLVGVRAILDRLSGRERDVVALREVVLLDVAGTAKALGISANAVRVAHHRALNKLRAEPPTVFAPEQQVIHLRP